MSHAAKIGVAHNHRQDSVVGGVGPYRQPLAVVRGHALSALQGPNGSRVVVLQPLIGLFRVSGWFRAGSYDISCQAWTSVMDSHLDDSGVAFIMSSRCKPNRGLDSPLVRDIGNCCSNDRSDG